MNRLWLFNPENDINLAYGNDTPRLSPMVRSLIDDGQLLPIWFADSCDCVLADTKYERWLAGKKAEFGMDVSIYDGRDNIIPQPWGWSSQTARLFRDMHLNTPGKEELNRIRDISHRRSSIYLAQSLGMEPPKEFFDAASAIRYATDHAPVYIKHPWSSSGRGVRHVRQIDDSVCAFISSSISRQGSVMIEPAYNKIDDFAMLFYADGNEVVFRGYSLFMTDGYGGYTGNYLGADDAIEARLINAGATRDGLHDIASRLATALSELIKNDYIGWLGVDMIVCEDHKIIPFVELNLRMTMGVVAWLWSRRWLQSGKEGLFKVVPSNNDLMEDYAVENNRLVSGTMRLVPHTMTSKFDFIVSVS